MLSKETKQEIWKLRQQGLSQSNISIKLNISLASVNLWCGRFDPQKEHNLTYKNILDQKQIDTILSFYKNNKSLKETHNEFKHLLSSRTIRALLIKNECYIKKTSHNNKRQKSINVINWKQRKKIELVKYKGGKCKICGYDKCIQALEFHHLDPLKKDFNISSNSFSFEKMKKEVDKCILICSNCHKELHYLNINIP